MEKRSVQSPSLHRDIGLRTSCDQTRESIIQAHGTIDDIGKMIFTRSEFTSKAHHAHFYEMLKGIVSSLHGVVLLDARLNDPDVCCS